MCRCGGEVREVFIGSNAQRVKHATECLPVDPCPGCGQHYRLPCPLCAQDLHNLGVLYRELQAKDRRKSEEIEKLLRSRAGLKEALGKAQRRGGGARR